MKHFIAAGFSLLTLALSAQNQDSVMIRKMFDEALVKGKSYFMLDQLANGIGGRLSGSRQAEQAVHWAKMTMESYGFDTVFLQPVMVPHWVRGEKEVVKFTLNGKEESLAACALGNSVGTGKDGIKAQVIEVTSLADLAKLGKDKVQGRIIFYNRPMEPRHIYTFDAYGSCVDQRGAGASEAAKYGAVAVLVRSMSHKVDDNPHTGSLRYMDSVSQIPALAISTKAAEHLSQLLKNNSGLEVYVRTTCEMLPDVLSYNVIGEIRGSKFPDKYIIAGGHLDSWDNGDGAHDDGAGCVQSIEALRILKTMNIKPSHSIRAVLFMNEENGLRGGKKYAESARECKENHMAAIESDRGGFAPRGFSYEGNNKESFKKIASWKKLLEPYGLHDFREGGSGADISPLKASGTTLIGYMPDSQRYFDYHHAGTDTFDSVNKRELEMGAASIAALLYLMDKYSW